MRKQMITMGLEGRKWELLKIAVDLFATKGYNVVSVRDLAHAINMTPGSIYHYYKSKEEILETIFAYDTHVINLLNSVLESALAEAEDFTKHPLECYYKLHCFPDQETRMFRNKITAIAVTLMYNDPQAEVIVYRDLVQILREYGRRILEKLISLNRIEPLDIDTFTILHTNHNLSCALLGFTSKPLSLQEWKNGMDMLFSMITLKEEPPAPLPDAYFYFLDYGWL